MDNHWAGCRLAPIAADRRRRVTIAIGGMGLVAALAIGCTSKRIASPTTVGPSTAVSTPATSAVPSTPTAQPTTTHPTKAAQPKPTVANPAGLSDAQLVGQLFISYAYGATATIATPAQRQANLALYGV